MIQHKPDVSIIQTAVTPYGPIIALITIVAVGPLNEHAHMVVQLASRKNAEHIELRVIIMRHELCAGIIVILGNVGHRKLHHGCQRHPLTFSQRVAIELELPAKRRQLRKSDVTSGAVHAGLPGKGWNGKGWRGKE